MSIQNVAGRVVRIGIQPMYEAEEGLIRLHLLLEEERVIRTINFPGGSMDSHLWLTQAGDRVEISIRTDAESKESVRSFINKTLRSDLASRA